MSVDADVSTSLDLFGKVVTDLQNNVNVSGNAITGELKYVTGYTGFDSNVENQSGNYLAIHADVADDDNAVIVVEVINGYSGPTTLDSDRVIVLRIADKYSQKVKVTATSNGKTVTKTYKLDQLVIDEN